MSEHIRVSKEDGVLTVTIDRPGKKNALTDAMYRAMCDALSAAETDADARVVVLRGEGDAFTAGNDVTEFAAVAMGGASPANVLRFIELLATLKKPLVAAVNGRAVGIGLTLLLHCDHVIVADDAQLSAPFVSLALVPEAASSLLLPARIGHARAFAVFALGEVVDASTAVAWGLANRVVPRSELTAAAGATAQRLAQQPLGSLVATKALMRDAGALTARMAEENRLFLERLVSAEAREAFMAFAERRAPNFSKLA